MELSAVMACAVVLVTVLAVILWLMVPCPPSADWPLRRLALHAYGLELGSLSFVADPPADFAAALELLRQK